MPDPAPPPPDPDDGRPPAPRKLTPAVVRRAAALVRRGNFRDAAARRLGVGPSTFRRWMALGAAFPGGLYGRLRAAVLDAEAAAEADAVAAVTAAGHADVRHLQWFLERKFPQRWGRSRGELTELRKRVRQLERAVRGPDPADGTDGGDAP